MVERRSYEYHERQEVVAIKGRQDAPLESFVSRGMDRQATQPAAVPSGRKRRRVSKKQKQEEEAQARALQMKADHDKRWPSSGYPELNS